MDAELPCCTATDKGCTRYDGARWPTISFYVLVVDQFTTTTTTTNPFKNGEPHIDMYVLRHHKSCIM